MELKNNGTCTLKAWSAVTIFARIALSASFLSAVADRFGIWGRAGTGVVAWGEFNGYLHYVRQLAPYLPDVLIGAAGWAATVVEIYLGVALLLGVALRATAWASALTLMVFAMFMLIFLYPESPLNASVFSAAAAASFLAMAPTEADAYSVDRVCRRRQQRAIDAARPNVTHWWQGPVTIFRPRDHGSDERPTNDAHRSLWIPA